MKKLTRRDFLQASAVVGAGLLVGEQGLAETPPATKALIAISLDLEMARNFPEWEDTHWDYEKGNLNEATKKYAVEAATRVKKAGGIVHFFLVGAALEQEDVGWLKEIIGMGHCVGNHTYDHVYLLAQKPEEVQYKFKRAPWLVAGKKVSDIVRDNVQMANAAINSRLGIEAAGFRTPGGFAEGLTGREDIQRMLLDLGFKWVSGKYPVHPNIEPAGSEPGPSVFEGIVQAQKAAQPLVYPSGLIEIPMAPISDVGAFRNGRWKLEHFLKATRLSLQWAIQHGAVFDFLAHPAVLSAKDPEFRTIEMICEMVNEAGDTAAIVSLDTIAKRVQH
jgi:hypothetical protein